jgi:hypothetical protein
MPDDPLNFLDSPSTSGSSQATSDPLDFLEQKSTNPLRKPARLAAQYAKGSLNRNPYIASYNLATTLVPAAAHRSRQRVSSTAQKELQAMDEKIANGEQLTRKELMFYDRTKEWAERKSKRAASLDTDTLINKGVKAVTGIDLESEDLGESIANVAGAFKNPKIIKDIPRMFTKTGRAAVSAERAAAKTKAGWDSLSKASKGNPEKSGIVNWAQQNGLTPREATLLLQSEGRINILGRASKKTKQFQRDVEGLKTKLGSKYDELREIGRAGGYLGSNQTLPLLDKLEKINGEINLTHVKGPESAAAEKALSEAIKDIESNGTTIEKLIATRQNLGQGINWKKVGVKEGLKTRMKEAISQTIDSANPGVGKQLREVDKKYRQYKKFKDVLDKKQAYMNVKGIPIPSGNIAFGVGLKVLGGVSPVTAAKYALIKEGVQRFSTALLTNPKLQGVHKKLVQAVLKGDTERQRKLTVIAQKILKSEDPELYDELGLD